MKIHILALLFLLQSVSLAEQLADGIHSKLSKSNDLQTITVIDKQVRSIDVIIRKDSKFSRGCWLDYGTFQIITLTNKSREEVYSYRFSDGEYKALSKLSEKHIQSARAFRLSVLLVKDEFNIQDQQ